MQIIRSISKLDIIQKVEQLAGCGAASIRNGGDNAKTLAREAAAILPQELHHDPEVHCVFPGCKIQTI